MKEEIVIEVENLRVDFESVVACKNVNFKVYKGEIFGLVGPNGAGKTTTLRVLSTLLKYTWGKIKIFGYDIEKDFKEIRKIIGFMPDFPPVYNELKVWEFLYLYASSFYFSSKRRILYEENPFFSKKESIFLLCIICFLVIGRIIGILNLNPDYFLPLEKSPSETKAEFYILMSKIIILFSSIILLFITFPKRLDLIRQFIRRKKGEKIFWWENNNSSLIANFFILIISVLSIFIIDIYVYLTGLLENYWLENILRILIFISSMLFFNFLIEGCRLKFEKGADNISILIIVFWFILIPAIYIIYALNVENPKLLFMSFSPLPFLIFTGKPTVEIRNSAILCLMITNIILFLTILLWKKAKIDFGEKYG